jgi:hypothetical protein
MPATYPSLSTRRFSTWGLSWGWGAGAGASPSEKPSSRRSCRAIRLLRVVAVRRGGECSKAERSHAKTSTDCIIMEDFKL